VGVSTCYPHLGLDECADHMALLTNADSKLYEAKRTGRDKVCFEINSEKKSQ
jgi:PleD family two-component response regulator